MSAGVRVQGVNLLSRGFETICNCFCFIFDPTSVPVSIQLSFPFGPMVGQHLEEDWFPVVLLLSPRLTKKENSRLDGTRVKGLWRTDDYRLDVDTRAVDS